MVQTRHHRLEHIRPLAPNRFEEDVIIVRVLVHHNLNDLQGRRYLSRLKPQFMANDVIRSPFYRRLRPTTRSTSWVGLPQDPEDGLNIIEDLAPQSGSTVKWIGVGNNKTAILHAMSEGGTLSLKCAAPHTKHRRRTFWMSKRVTIVIRTTSKVSLSPLNAATASNDRPLNPLWANIMSTCSPIRNEKGPIRNQHPMGI